MWLIGMKFRLIEAELGPNQCFLVLHLGQPVTHRQHGLLVVDVHRGLERKGGDGRRVDVGEAEAGVLGEHVSAAGRAPAAQTRRSEVEGAQRSGALRHLDLLGLPQRERVHRAGRPAAARVAVAVAHRGGRADDLHFDGAAEAAPGMGSIVRHETLSFQVAGRAGESVVERMLPRTGGVRNARRSAARSRGPRRFHGKSERQRASGQ